METFVFVEVVASVTPPPSDASAAALANGNSQSAATLSASGAVKRTHEQTNGVDAPAAKRVANMAAKASSLLNPKAQQTTGRLPGNVRPSRLFSMAVSSEVDVFVVLFCRVAPPSLPPS